MKKILVLVLLVLASIISACKKDAPKPETVSSYTEYSDPSLKFGVKYPKGWAQAVDPGKVAMFYSSEKIQSGFTDFDPQGERGAKIMVGSMIGGDAELQTSIEGMKSVFTDPNVFKNEGITTLNGMSATKVSYAFDVEDTKFKAERYYVIKDSVITYLETGVIGNYDDYKVIFDEVQKAFVTGSIAKAAAVVTTNDSANAKPADLTEPPSTTLKSFSSPNFTIQHPANFSPTNGNKGTVTFTGARNDCSIQIDILDPKGIALDKIVEQNKKAYKSAASATKVGNLPGFVFNYNGGKNVASKAYFAMNGVKLYRITVNYFIPQKDNYLPVFEKCISTFFF